MGSDELEPRIVPNMGEMTIQLKSPCSSISLPINQTENLLLIPEFDISKKVVIYVSGWLSNVDDDKIEELARAYNCRGDYNFMALNASNFIQTLYTWSAFNTEEVGAILGQGIVKIASKIPIGNIHLIGHSLGAHIVGKAGREFTAQTNQTLPRITGLDPANPCFNQGEALSGLYRGDAAFVDVIHSNPGVLGKAHPIGDADFYPEGLGSIKPGCIMFGCSHSRAVDYYLETIFPGNEMNFLAKRCNSLQGYNAGQCNGPEYPMGIATPSNLKGDYFLSVNRESPFGKNASDIVSINHTTCGFCNI
ncbi:vitellogenin-1-like [Haematobia irritans]|uniref:vitellogenin-1-like n=1 Tax=Haematobia irritans TaxID=7368 RepID=UPI003F50AAC8